jgi:hypothetical protein
MFGHQASRKRVAAQATGTVKWELLRTLSGYGGGHAVVRVAKSVKECKAGK